MTKLKDFANQTPYLEKFMPFGNSHSSYRSVATLIFGFLGAMHDMQGVNSLNQLMGGDGSPNALAHSYFS